MLAASDYKVMQINLRISTYSDTVAACERLYKQPIPTAYTRHGRSLPRPVLRLVCYCQLNRALIPIIMTRCMMLLSTYTARTVDLPREDHSSRMLLEWLECLTMSTAS